MATRGEVAEVVEAAFAVPEGAPLTAGFYVVGEFLGVKEPSTFTRGSETINVKPKVGVKTQTGQTSVSCADMDVLRAVVGRLSKGERICVPIVIRPPFGASGPIKVTARQGDDDGGSWE
jgi:hypothetical protein